MIGRRICDGTALIVLTSNQAGEERKNTPIIDGDYFELEGGVKGLPPVSALLTPVRSRKKERRPVRP